MVNNCLFIVFLLINKVRPDDEMRDFYCLNQHEEMCKCLDGVPVRTVYSASLTCTHRQVDTHLTFATKIKEVHVNLLVHENEIESYEGGQY